MPEPPPRIPTAACGPYELVKQYSADAFCKVWAARHANGAGALVDLLEVEERVAAVPAFREAFLAEAAAMRRVVDPALIPFVVADFANGKLFGVREHVEGVALESVLARAVSSGIRVPAEIAARIGIAVLESLAAIHAASTSSRPSFHGDVCPQTVILEKGGAIRLAASCLGLAAARPDAIAPPQRNQRIAYKAPEQLTRTTPRGFDGRADIFALGVILWEAVQARRLFDAPSAEAVAQRIASGPIAPLDSAALPVAFVTAVMGALSRDPNHRVTARLALDALQGIPALATGADALLWIERNLAPHGLAGDREGASLFSERRPVKPPPRPPGESDVVEYLAPASVPMKVRPEHEEPAVKIVLNVPEEDVSATNEAAILAARRRRQFQTVKVDRAQMEAAGLLLAAAAREANEAKKGSRSADAARIAGASESGTLDPSFDALASEAPARHMRKSRLGMLIAVVATVGVLSGAGALLLRSRGATSGVSSQGSATAHSPAAEPSPSSIAGDSNVTTPPTPSTEPAVAIDSAATPAPAASIAPSAPLPKTPPGAPSPSRPSARSPGKKGDVASGP